jgi:hypothetical protein
MLALPTGNHVLLNSSESQLHHAHLPGQQQHTAVWLSFIHSFIHSCYTCSRSSFEQRQPIPNATDPTKITN